MPRPSTYRKKWTLVERFWRKVDRRGEDECWPWMAGTNGGRGYGRFRISAAEGGTYAHRFAYHLTYGEALTTADTIRHTCDFPLCCNPKHLVKGSQVENLADMRQKNRHRCGRGERHRSSKLTGTQVAEIRSSEESNTELAQRMGVKQHTISNIRRGVTWRYT
jgi:hypothetical protein